MNSGSKLKSAFNSVWSFFSGVWGAAKTIIFVLLIMFLIASHVFTGLAVITAGFLQTVFGTTTALANARSMQQETAQKLNARENELEKMNAESAADQNKIRDLEARSASQTKELKNLRAQNNELKRGRFVDFKGKRVRLDDAIKTASTGIQSRTKRVAAANVASAAGESIPFWGIAIIVGATTYELTSACDTMTDLYDLQVAIDPSQASEEDRKYVCGLRVPTREELWDDVKSSPGIAWTSAVNAYEDGAEWVGNLEPPDFSGTWNTAMSWLGSWFE
ncbi:hypothetical protein [Roseovarius atlanticus]|uniref:hypothetical protein n=1 Tax=Roseovarius atlanticus TaxID=1641875 RepID=UPI000AFDA7E1|nr:hypothetical protein [Roseovarius atlanticus]